MSSLASAGFAVFIVVLFVGIYLTLFGLPGTMLIFIDVLIYAVATGFANVGWKLLLFLLFFAILAEAIDILLGMTRAYKPPVLMKSLLVSAMGAVGGMLLLTPFLMGLGTWTGFFLGGLTGLVIIESFRLIKIKGPSPAGNGAFLGMIGKKALKGVLAIIMIFVSLTHIYS